MGVVTKTHNGYSFLVCDQYPCKNQGPKYRCNHAKCEFAGECGVVESTTRFHGWHYENSKVTCPECWEKKHGPQIKQGPEVNKISVPNPVQKSDTSFDAELRAKAAKVREERAEAEREAAPLRALQQAQWIEEQRQKKEKAVQAEMDKYKEQMVRAAETGLNRVVLKTLPDKVADGAEIVKYFAAQGVSIHSEKIPQYSKTGSTEYTYELVAEW
jgi:hypothetical protein